LVCAGAVERAQAERETQLAWGISAMTLGAPREGAPDLESLLGDKREVAVLDRFYRLGGENLPVTPTECRVAYNADGLLVVFRCREDNMDYPATSHRTDWYAQLHSASEQDASYPDKVEVIVWPKADDRTYCQFAATADGLSFGARRHAGPAPVQTDNETATNGFERIKDFDAQVVRRQKEWLVFFRIPWRCLGGKPGSHFGFVPLRTRWRDSEVTSPVAGYFTDRPPLNSCIETHFQGRASTFRADRCLCRLPSGLLCWQRPARLSYPDRDTVRDIWQMEQSLSQPTGQANFARRVYLTQRWIDLLDLEGFCFRPASGSIAEENVSPSLARWRVNGALRGNDPAKAYRLLDAYLRDLDAVSRRWFADGSPGNIRADQWQALSQMEGVEEQAGVVTLHCLAGTRPVDLHLSFPTTGGLRLQANAEGWFKPAGLLPVNVSHAAGRVWIAASNARAAVVKHPFGITLGDAAGRPVVELGPGSIAFRFDAQGKVLASDFRNRLDKTEVVWGFGEKFDHFNQHGSVLTLWGVDAWTANTEGLRNQSYKPIPVFHSSKGYTVFVNSPYRLRADIGRTRSSEYRLSQHGPILDCCFWMEPPEKALQSYTDLTGKPLLPPQWAFEPWMGRTGRGWSANPGLDAVAEEERVVKRFGSLDIPHSAIYAEGPGADSPALNEFMARRGIKVLSWYFSSIGKNTQARLLPELAPDQLPVLNAGENTSADPISYVDFTSPEALELGRRWWKPRLDLGVAGSMVDFGDRVPEQALFHDGQKGDAMHNFYSYDYQRTYHQVFAERRGGDFILFGRAAAPGTQQWAAQFPGDHCANFLGLDAVLTGALNLCACGFSTWGSDLGGFLGWPDPPVFMRWTQFACFSPLMRSHGRTPREPWEYGEAAVANYKRFAWVRENLLDYIYSAAETAHQTGIPMMRSLAVAYPKEAALAAVADEYLFGPDLLVAPVITEKNTRPVAFPAGRWTSLWDGGVETGPRRVEMTVPPDAIPVYVREGAVVPVNMSTNLQFGQSMTGGRVSAVLVTPPETAKEKHHFDLRLKAQASYLLIYGARLAAVKVDGVTLPQVPDADPPAPSPGWRADAPMQRVIIGLPPPKAGVFDIDVRYVTIRH
jgi:alpha-glucosidase (family GH31 glycosyl hydrolase)